MNKFPEQINFTEFLAIVKNIFILSIKCYEKWVFGISKTRLKQHYKKKILLSNWNVSWVFILAVGPSIGCERILPIISIHFSTFLFFEVKYFFLFWIWHLAMRSVFAEGKCETGPVCARLRASCICLNAVAVKNILVWTSLSFHNER